MAKIDRFCITCILFVLLAALVALATAGPVFIVFEDGSYQFLNNTQLSGCFDVLQWGCQ